MTTGSDFIKTKSLSLVKVVELIEPSVVMILLLLQCPATTPSLSSIRDAGSKLHIGIKYFPLDSQTSCDKLVANLASYSYQSYWLVVENLHLMDDYPKVLMDMSKVCTQFLILANPVGWLVQCRCCPVSVFMSN